ncbi:Gfo/Idh/MocA family oxidoreductase [Balneolaceae bacterium ANBcel3]|nr:Gfo/Idh/MocA family oxidoreductase [Balneolaceae bacterium ANBcel3]
MQISRRHFLEITSMLAGSAVAASSMPWISAFSQPETFGKDPSDRVRIGFIGLGTRGQTLLLNMMDFTERLNVEIAALCDIYQPHFERMGKMTGGKVPCFYDYREMLDSVELDGVVIATPLHQHEEPTIHAMEKGVHVFCEKSMARTLDEVKNMYDAHKEHQKILLVGHQRLFSPVYLSALERIRNNEIGPVTMINGNWHRNQSWILYGGLEPGSALDRQLNWRLYREYSAGMITELCSHHLQVANWVLDSTPISVSGSGSINFWKDHREVWDNFSLIFKYPGGIHFKYSCLQSNKHNGMQIEVLGNKGTMDLEVNKQYEEFPPAPPAIRQLIHSIERNIFDTIPIGGATWVPAEPVAQGGRFISDDWEMNETQLFLEAFVDFIRKGEAPQKLTDEGYHASIWALLAEEATYSDQHITIPEPYLLSKS